MLEIMLASAFKKLNEPGLEINPEIFEKLMASDGTVNEYFGYSVAITTDGSTVVVGDSLDDDNEKGADAGSVYIFTKQVNGSYLQTQKLLASDGAAGDYFGHTVAISADGLTFVVGAYASDDKGSLSGSVYIFTKQVNGSYLQTQKLLASDGAAGDHFGYRVDVSADGLTFVVGASLDDNKGSRTGSAYIFTKQANGTYTQLQKLLASDGALNDYFGHTVTISGDGSTLVVGAFGDDDKGSSSGSAYIFTKQSNGIYTQIQKLVPADGAADDWFGYSVAISTDGSTVVVGAYQDDDKGSSSGSAYIFIKQTNGSYLRTHKLVASDGAANDYFGVKVAVSGDGSTIVVSASNDDDKGTDSGSAYIFIKQTDGSYLETQKLVASDGAANSYFGTSIAISNTSVAIGAPNYLGKGAVYVY